MQNIGESTSASTKKVFFFSSCGENDKMMSVLQVVFPAARFLFKPWDMI